VKKINQFKTFLIALVVLIVFGTVVFTMRSDANNIIIRTLNDGISVVQRVFADAARGISNFGESTFEIFNTNEENQLLRSQMYNYQLLRISNELLEEENEELRLAVEVAETLRDFDHITAVNIGRDIHNWHNFITLNQGSINGVEVGMAVLSAEGYLIGKITAVGQLASRVHLMRSHDLINPHVMLLGDNNSFARLAGYDAETNELMMVEVSRDVEVEIGTQVITTGMGDVFPRGLLVGTVSRYEVASDQLTQTIFIENNVNYDDLNFMFIIMREMVEPDL